MANYIKVVQDKNGNNIFPITHEKAVRDSSGVSLDAKISALESKTYVEAWDGASAPVVANIPAGVVVSYNGTNYTGTLAASASTDGKVYLVKDGTEYDRYASTINLGGTYIWSYLGTTAMSLTGYATIDDLDQLEQEINGVSKNVKDNYYLGSDGTEVSANGWCYSTDYIPVANGDVVEWLAGAKWGAPSLVLYDSSKTRVGGYVANANPRTITISNASAAYMRASFVMEELSSVYIKRNDVTVWTAISQDVPGLAEKVQVAENNSKGIIGEAQYCMYCAGHINIDNGKRTVDVVGGNFILYRGQVQYQINNWSSFSISNITGIASQLVKLVFNTDNLSLQLLSFSASSNYPVVAVLRKDYSDPHNVLGVVSSPVIDIISIDSAWAIPRSSDDGVPYAGEALKIPTYQIIDFGVVTGLPSHQSGIAYGDYAVFFIGDGTAQAFIVSLASKTLLATLSLPSPGTFHAPHCNTAVLGPQKRSENSICPLIYVSQWTAGYERACFVYDVTLNNGTFAIELVQVIRLDSVSASILGSGPCDFVVDIDNDRLVAFAYMTAQSESDGTALMIAEFDLPAINEASVSLSDSDVLHNVSGKNLPVRQDAFYFAGRIVLASGFGTSESPGTISAVDIGSGRIVTSIDLAGYFGGEPEFLNNLGNKILMTNGGTSIKRFLSL